MKIPTLHIVTPASNFAEDHVLDIYMHDKVSLLLMMENPFKLRVRVGRKARYEPQEMSQLL